MKTIYIDSNFKCHIADDGTMTAIETDFFDDKCDVFIEGCCYEDVGNGVAIYAWKDYAELEEAQIAYERQLLSEYKTELAELDAIFLEQQYNNLMEDL